MLPTLPLPLLDDVIAKIKKLQPLTFEEEIVYLMGVRKLSIEEAAAIVGEEISAKSGVSS